MAQTTNLNNLRDKLAEERNFNVIYRVFRNNEPVYIQLRIVNPENRGSVSQIVLGYRIIDFEIMQAIEEKRALENALSHATMANKAKNVFLSNMSHDMRTPLNAIFGFTALARKYLAEPDAAENYLNKIERSSRQLLELIEKVLDLSWTESNDIKLKE